MTTARIPGFYFSAALAITFISLLILLPLAALFSQLFQLSWSEFIAEISSPRAIAAYLVTLKAAGLSSIITSAVGFLLAWLLTRYRFYGATLLDALIDLPFAVPTSVAGLAIAMLYDYSSPLGLWLDSNGMSPLFNWVGISIAMNFTSLPFGVRLVQLRLQNLDQTHLDAALTLGASPAKVVITQVVIPLKGAIISGFLLSFIRSLGEFGALQFIAGNIPFQSETLSLLIVIRLDEQNFAGAISVVMIIFSAALTLLALALYLQHGRRFTPKKLRRQSND